MSKTIETDLTAFRGIFSKYAELGGNYDDKASPLATIILDEVHTAHIMCHPRETEIETGKQALVLLKMLPSSYPEKPTLHIPTFPKTRRILWRQVIRSLLYSEGNDLKRFVQAIINPGKISPGEEKTLRDCIKEGLENHGFDNGWTCEKICKIIKENRAECGEVAFRGLLHFLASKCPISQLQKMIS